MEQHSLSWPTRCFLPLDNDASPAECAHASPLSPQGSALSMTDSDGWVSALTPSTLQAMGTALQRSCMLLLTVLGVLACTTVVWKDYETGTVVVHRRKLVPTNADETRSCIWNPALPCHPLCLLFWAGEWGDKILLLLVIYSEGCIVHGVTDILEKQVCRKRSMRIVRVTMNEVLSKVTQRNIKSTSFHAPGEPETAALSPSYEAEPEETLTPNVTMSQFMRSFSKRSTGFQSPAIARAASDNQAALSADAMTPGSLNAQVDSPASKVDEKVSVEVTEIPYLDM